MDNSLYDLRMQYWHEAYKHWTSQELFSFPWFFDIVFLTIIYIVWVKLVDKSRLRELLLFGSLLSVVSITIDVIAVTVGLWEYKISLFPFSPAPFPFDFTVIPILYMIVMQYTSSWRSYLTGTVIAAAVFSFIIEVIYVWLGIKVFHKFNLFYMFLLVLIVAIVVKAIYNWIVTIQVRNSGNKDNSGL